MEVHVARLFNDHDPSKQVKLYCMTYSARFEMRYYVSCILIETIGVACVTRLKGVRRLNDAHAFAHGTGGVLHLWKRH